MVVLFQQTTEKVGRTALVDNELVFYDFGVGSRRKSKHRGSIYMQLPAKSAKKWCLEPGTRLQTSRQCKKMVPAQLRAKGSHGQTQKFCK